MQTVKDLGLKERKSGSYIFPTNTFRASSLSPPPCHSPVWRWSRRPWWSCTPGHRPPLRCATPPPGPAPADQGSAPSQPPGSGHRGKPAITTIKLDPYLWGVGFSFKKSFNRDKRTDIAFSKISLWYVTCFRNGNTYLLSHLRRSSLCRNCDSDLSFSSRKILWLHYFQ